MIPAALDDKGMIMNRCIKWFVTINAIVLSGCFSEATRTLEPAEKELGTAGTITMHYHSALYYPEEIALRSGGYLVGIEKGEPENILQTGEKIMFKNPDATDKALKNKQEAVQAGKIMFVSHIVLDQPPGSVKRNCFLYNAYYRPKLETPPISHCTDAPEPLTSVPARDAYRSSWQAMETMQYSLSRDIASHSYTHILVVVMGWNTVQEEAVRNVNSIVRGIRHASENDSVKFNPIVIGVTWPSQWNSPWLDPIYKLASFDTKARDADEVGLTWLGVLLEKTIPQAKKSAGGNLPVVVLGHSFGARAASTAACAGPVIAEGAEPQTYAKQPVDLLINYQGAFLISRLLGESTDGGFSLGEGCPRVKYITLTSSKNDTAVKTAFWGIYAGNDTSFKKYCTQPIFNINCVTATPQGGITTARPASQKITYINSDDLITYNAFYTGGGAHSDIYRDEHGALSWSLIKELSDNGAPPSVTTVQP